MKKKVIIAMLAVSLLTVAGGCGTKESDGGNIETTEEVAMTDGVDKEPVEEPEEVSDAEVETSESGSGVSVTTAATGELDVNAFEEDEAKDHQFGDMSYIAQYRDLRNTTKLNSESTEDVWAYLTEDGIISSEAPDELWDVGVSSYTGRWAYPKLLESELTKDFYLYDWTDSFCSYIADDGENNNAILFCTGYDVFNSYTDADSEAEFTFEKAGTYNINDQDIEVYSVSGDESSVTYLYKLGGFSIVIEFSDGDEVASEDALIEVMNDIIL